MNLLNDIKNLKKLIFVFVSFFLLNGTDVPPQNEIVPCPKNYSCLTTFFSPGAIILARELDLSLVPEPRPAPLEKIKLILDKNGKFLEVKIAENVYYYQAIWKNKKILVSRFDLDTSKSLRTLASQSLQVLKEPNLNASVLKKLDENTIVNVFENTHPLTENKGYVKIQFNDTVGWIKRSSLSDDEYDIRYHLVDLKTLVRPYLFVAKENDFKIKLGIIGNPLIASDCRIGEDLCSASSRMGTSSFGMPQEAVYFDLKLEDGNAYTCEIRREDFVGELQRMIQGDISEEELDPFMNCSLDVGEEEQTESEER